jgi:hypothetical protein
MNKAIMVIAVAALLVICACSKNPTEPDYQKEIAVYGFLWTDQPLAKQHAVSITWTRPIASYYDPSEAAVKNAQITLTDNNSGRIYPLYQDEARPGFYYNDSLFIHPQTVYSLLVQAEGRTVMAETTTPGRITLATELSRTSVNTVTPKNLGYEKPVQVNGGSPNQMMLVDISCQETYENAEYINSFGPNKYPEDQEEYDGGRDGGPKRIQALLKYDDLISDEYAGQHTIYWYGSMLVFYGSHNMQILAIDGNYHSYLYKENPTLSSGVKGGIGVFGSVSGELFRLQVVKELTQ